MTVKDGYPLLNIQENLQKLKGTCIITSLDACGVYHTIEIKGGSPDSTTFISQFSMCWYIRMPIGLNAGSVYNRIQDIAMSNLPRDYWLSYLDDVLVYSSKVWEHLKHLRRIVEAHSKAGIKIQTKI